MKGIRLMSDGWVYFLGDVGSVEALLERPFLNHFSVLNDRILGDRSPDPLSTTKRMFLLDDEESWEVLDDGSVRRVAKDDPLRSFHLLKALLDRQVDVLWKSCSSASMEKLESKFSDYVLAMRDEMEIERLDKALDEEGLSENKHWNSVFVRRDGFLVTFTELERYVASATESHITWNIFDLRHPPLTVDIWPETPVAQRLTTAYVELDRSGPEKMVWAFRGGDPEQAARLGVLAAETDIEQEKNRVVFSAEDFLLKHLGRYLTEDERTAFDDAYQARRKELET